MNAARTRGDEAYFAAMDLRDGRRRLLAVVHAAIMDAEDGDTSTIAVTPANADHTRLLIARETDGRPDIAARISVYEMVVGP